MNGVIVCSRIQGKNVFGCVLGSCDSSFGGDKELVIVKRREVVKDELFIITVDNLDF